MICIASKFLTWRQKHAHLKKVANEPGTVGSTLTDSELYAQIRKIDETLINVQRLKEKVLHDLGSVEQQVMEIRSTKRASRPLS